MIEYNLLQSKKALAILFDWQGLSLEDLKSLCDGLNIKNIRWLAIHHPDNKTREDLYRLSNVEVGKKTVINSGLYIYDSYQPLIKIGEHCALAANISLIAESGPNMSDLNNIPEVETLIKKGEIIIEDHAWIGANVIIMPGVRIGHHSIIGAGSIVTSDIEPFSIYRGQPAKLIRRLR